MKISTHLLSTTSFIVWILFKSGWRTFVICMHFYPTLIVCSVNKSINFNYFSEKIICQNSRNGSWKFQRIIILVSKVKLKWVMSWRFNLHLRHIWSVWRLHFQSAAVIVDHLLNLLQILQIICRWSDFLILIKILKQRVFQERSWKRLKFLKSVFFKRLLQMFPLVIPSSRKRKRWGRNSTNK